MKHIVKSGTDYVYVDPDRSKKLVDDGVKTLYVSPTGQHFTVVRASDPKAYLKTPNEALDIAVEMGASVEQIEEWFNYEVKEV